MMKQPWRPRLNNSKKVPFLEDPGKASDGSGRLHTALLMAVIVTADAYYLVGFQPRHERTVYCLWLFER
jgi:hypothetical protein